MIVLKLHPKNHQKRGPVPIYILSHTTTIASANGNEIFVNDSDAIKRLLNPTRIGERYYKLAYMKKSAYEITCPVFKDSKADENIVVPDFLLSRRKYPVHVYFFAINLYSSNPGLGQRGVAKATREKFGLSGFSHSTVSRVFRELEGHIAKGAACNGAAGSPETRLAEGCGAVPARDAPKADKPQTAADTRARREAMAAFLRSVLGTQKINGLTRYGEKMVNGWYDKHRRLGHLGGLYRYAQLQKSTD